MAKYEKRFRGDFDGMLMAIHDLVMARSSTASMEDRSYYSQGDFRTALRVYERYSLMGGNRVSMAVMLTGTPDEYQLSIITSGGSTATFFKMNTIGEESFLNTAIEAVERYLRDHPSERD